MIYLPISCFDQIIMYCNNWDSRGWSNLHSYCGRQSNNEWTQEMLLLYMKKVSKQYAWTAISYSGKVLTTHEWCLIMLKTREYDKLLFHKALEYLRIAIMTELCSMLTSSYYAQFYACLICTSLLTAHDWPVVNSGAACVLEVLSGELDVGSKMTNYHDDIPPYFLLWSNHYVL